MAVPSRSADAATIFGFVGSGRGSRLIIALPVALRCMRGIFKIITPSQDDFGRERVEFASLMLMAAPPRAIYV